MKTIHPYEASDIDMEDPVHGFLATAIVILTLKLTRPREGVKPEELLKDLIADILNNASDAGIAITVAEEIPAVYPR